MFEKNGEIEKLKKRGTGGFWWRNVHSLRATFQHPAGAPGQLRLGAARRLRVREDQAGGGATQHHLTESRQGVLARAYAQ